MVHKYSVMNTSRQKRMTLQVQLVNACKASVELSKHSMSLMSMNA